MGNAEFKGLSHVSPISTRELLAACGHAISADDLARGTEGAGAASGCGGAGEYPPLSEANEPWHPISRTQFALLFDGSKVPYQLTDHLFDAYTITMRDLGGEEGLRRPDVFRRSQGSNGNGAGSASPALPLPLLMANKSGGQKPFPEHGGACASKGASGGSSSCAANGTERERERGDLNESSIAGLEHSDPLARTDFLWLVMHLFAVLPHSAPMSLMGDLSLDKGLQQGAAAEADRGGAASAAEPLIPVDLRLSLLYDLFLRRVQRLARIRRAEQRRRSSVIISSGGGASASSLAGRSKGLSPLSPLSPSSNGLIGGPANTPTKLALIRGGRLSSSAISPSSSSPLLKKSGGQLVPAAEGNAGNDADDADLRRALVLAGISEDPEEIPSQLSVADIKDAIFATVKLALARYRGSGAGTGRTQFADRRCAGCRTVPTNLTYDCSDCLAAARDQHFHACAAMFRSAAVSPRSVGGAHSARGGGGGGGGPLSPRSVGSAASNGRLGATAASVAMTAASAASTAGAHSGAGGGGQDALLSAAALTAPVHALGIPITTLLCNRCVGQYEGYGSGIHHTRHLKTHAARRSNWAPNPLRPTHAGTECSACGVGPIEGVRHRCLDCLDNIDLCGACYRDGEEPLCHSIRHRMWAITVPLTLDEEASAFTEAIVAPMYTYLGLPRPRNAATKRLNPHHTDTDYSERHNEDFSETHFTDALLTIEQRREVEAERANMALLRRLKEAALRIAREWPAHVSDLLDEDRTVAFLEAEERGEEALEAFRAEMDALAESRAVAAAAAAAEQRREREAEWAAAERSGFSGHGVGHRVQQLAEGGTSGAVVAVSSRSGRMSPRGGLSPRLSPRGGAAQLSPPRSATATSSVTPLRQQVRFLSATPAADETGTDADAIPLRRPLSAALQAMAEAARADPAAFIAATAPYNNTSNKSKGGDAEGGDGDDGDEMAPEDIAAARLARHFAAINSDERARVSKELFVKWGNRSEVVAALFRGFEVRHARTCADVEGVEYSEYASSMAAGGVVGGGSGGAAEHF